MSTKLDLAIKEFDPTKKGLWKGNSLKQDAFMQLYIEKLYGDQLHYLKFTEIVITFTKEMLDYFFIDGPVLWDRKKNMIFDLQDLPEKYISEYRKTKKRFTLYPILLTDIKRTGEYLLYMLYDRKYNCIEIFDSTNNIYDLLDVKEDFFTNFFRKIYNKTVEINYTNYGWILPQFFQYKYCKSEKYLYKSTDYCIVWFLWVLELRLKNKKLLIKEILEKIFIILDKNPEVLCEILIGYAQFIDKVTNGCRYIIKNNKIDRISLKTKTKVKSVKKNRSSL